MINLNFLLWVILSTVGSCTAVTVILDGKEVDCNGSRCACCKGGVARCGPLAKVNDGDDYCLDGCVDTIWGHRCKNSCHGNCYRCKHNVGIPCYECKNTFYDVRSNCSKSCSVGCNSCSDDGTCSQCTENIEGVKCETCIQGKYGTNCTNDCLHRNCRCTTDTYCDSCKDGFYGRTTYCQSPCSAGCQNGECNDDGTCTCRQNFLCSLCMDCITGYYGGDCNTRCSGLCSDGMCMKNGICNQCKPRYFGEQCKNMCSSGCSDGICSRNGTCACRLKFTGSLCDACEKGKYGANCEHECSVGCTTSSCGKDNGFCNCLPNFNGKSCLLCTDGFYGASCQLRCFDKCINNACSISDGKCTFGCRDGFTSDNCTAHCHTNCKTCAQNDPLICTSCFNDFSGTNCICPPNCNCASGSDICLSCINNYMHHDKQCKCHAQNYCIDKGCNECIDAKFYSYKNSCCECPNSCKDGLCSSGHRCQNGCEDLFYGSFCSLKCTDIDNKCFKCAQVDGSCLRCTDGYFPNVNGTCMKCLSSCKANACDPNNGSCSKGCKDGLWGIHCTETCNLLCKTCDRINGGCIDCVLPVLYGQNCDLSCSSSCISSKCNENGECLNGCSDGYTGVKCDTVKKTGDDVGLNVGMVVVGVVAGISATLLILVIIRRQSATNVIGGTRSAIEHGRSKTESKSTYEIFDDENGERSHNHEYEMPQTSTEGNGRHSRHYVNTEDYETVIN
ncbi:platelet endothelial aggregation receptor 1-like isoform X1 [Mya arenaria]|uniref:platelet endothelial aggregation receptor 1-like isoform X1 n=2 Tax=Mya arenaria TaxID=6604 RepID=UPI0022E7D8CF|nr:platelet endothelial aggregation receptor 1-like isoform X1 [Mya arenaria]XP_052763966.1 platelet endothelial aggregation receptor 1-like isoform X1 [Mya arenaria]